MPGKQISQVYTSTIEDIKTNKKPLLISIGFLLGYIYTLKTTEKEKKKKKGISKQ